jgi:hypothetical protein
MALRQVRLGLAEPRLQLLQHQTKLDQGLESLVLNTNSQYLTLTLPTGVTQLETTQSPAQQDQHITLIDHQQSLDLNNGERRTGLGSYQRQLLTLKQTALSMVKTERY